MRRLTLPLLLVIGLALFAGCGGDSEPDPGSGSGTTSEAGQPATAADLAKRTFTSTSVSGHELVPDSQITLEFTPDTLGFRAGCNSNLGKYKITNGNLKFTPGPSTLMGCPEELLDQDEWLRDFLAAGSEAELAGTKLTLSGTDDVVIELDQTGALPSS